MALMSDNMIGDIGNIAYLYTMTENLRLAAVNCKDPAKLPQLLEERADDVMRQWRADQSPFVSDEECMTIRDAALAAWTQNRIADLFKQPRPA